MKKSVFLLGFLSITVFANAQNNKTPHLTKSLSSEKIDKVEANTSGGSISVSATSASEARVEVYISSPNGKNISKEEIQKRLDEFYTLDISVSGGQLTANAKNKKQNINWKEALNISFKIYTTANINTQLRTSGGNIDLAGISGNQNFATSGGSLTVSGTSGSLKGRTSGGNIDIKNSKDEIDLATSGGSITAENCNGNLNLKTSGGSLSLSSLKGNIDAGTSGGSVNADAVEGSLKAHTSGGNVHLNSMSGSVDASTSGGNMSIAINNLGEFVKLSNSGGNIHLQMPKDKGLNLDIHGDKISINPLNNFSGSKEDDQIKGNLNGGGIPVNIRAGSGRVDVSLK